MITTTNQFIRSIKSTLETAAWQHQKKPWFRGESADEKPLCPRIAKYSGNQENYFVQTFRQKAGGLVNVPHREDIDLWLFLAQHYGLPTRLLDWTEGALLGLYFAVNHHKSNARVYMLNHHLLNSLATGYPTDYLSNYLTSGTNGPPIQNIRLAWRARDNDDATELPIAIPATYQDHRMIAQRSCFTVHGKSLEPIPDQLAAMDVDTNDYLVEYRIDDNAIESLLNELAVLGITSSTVFPDLDNLAKDMIFEMGMP